MVLPNADGKVLLQSFESNGQTIWDGFGCFYSSGEDPKKTAQKVIFDSFKLSLDTEALVERAILKYFITKPTGLVDLEITVYFANLADASLSSNNIKWFDNLNIPYGQMHVATGKWLPIILKKPELLKAVVQVDQPDDHTQGTVTEFTTK